MRGYGVILGEMQRVFVGSHRSSTADLLRGLYCSVMRPALLTAILVLCGGAFAEIQPSFQLDVCAWSATDIVIVTEGETIDGIVDVLESWKGDLRRGDRITVSELAAFAPEASRAVAKTWDQGDQPQAVVTGSRMILFLPAGQHGMNVSMAWIEDDQVFAFAQHMNPGPSELSRSGMRERQLAEVVDDIVRAQRTLTEAIRSNDSQKVASAVPPLLRIDSAHVRRMILESLGAAGEIAVPAIREVLYDESLLHHHADAIAALGKAGGRDAAADIAHVLKQELAFWQKVGPGLDANWWNSERDDLNLLRSHYGRVHGALPTLKGLRAEESRDVVTAFRTLWRAHPQLGGIGGDQLGRACDEVLGALPH